MKSRYDETTIPPPPDPNSGASGLFQLNCVV